MEVYKCVISAVGYIIMLSLGVGKLSDLQRVSSLKQSGTVLTHTLTMKQNKLKRIGSLVGWMDGRTNSKVTNRQIDVKSLG